LATPKAGTLCSHVSDNKRAICAVKCSHDAQVTWGASGNKKARWILYPSGLAWLTSAALSVPPTTYWLAWLWFPNIARIGSCCLR